MSAIGLAAVSLMQITTKLNLTSQTETTAKHQQQHQRNYTNNLTAVLSPIKDVGTKWCLPAQDKIMALSFEVRCFFAVCFTLIMFGGVFVNGLAVYIAHATRQLKVRSIRLMWYLCINDTFSSVVTNGTYITFMVFYQYAPCPIKKVFNALAQFLSYSSIFLVCYIGFDRYVRIRFLNKYEEKFTTPRYVASLIFSMLLVLIQTSISIIGPIIFGEGYGALLNLPINVFASAIVLVSYGLSLVKLYNYNKSSKVLSMSDRSLVKMASFHLLLLFCCYGPSLLYGILYKAHRFSEEAIGVVISVLFLLNSLHGTLNALVFLIVNRKNKDKFCHILSASRLLDSIRRLQRTRTVRPAGAKEKVEDVVDSLKPSAPVGYESEGIDREITRTRVVPFHLYKSTAPLYPLNGLTSSAKMTPFPYNQKKKGIKKISWVDDKTINRVVTIQCESKNIDSKKTSQM